MGPISVRARNRSNRYCDVNTTCLPWGAILEKKDRIFSSQSQEFANFPPLAPLLLFDTRVFLK